MKTGALLGNIIWILFGGVEVALIYLVGGILLCCTIIGIPFGLKVMKIGVHAFLPFGYTYSYNPERTGCLATIMNLLWVFTFGLILATIHLLLGIFFCITIIGIPFGLAHFKLMRLVFAPFGADIIPVV